MQFFQKMGHEGDIRETEPPSYALKYALLVNSYKETHRNAYKTK